MTPRRHIWCLAALLSVAAVATAQTSEDRASSRLGSLLGSAPKPRPANPDLAAIQARIEEVSALPLASRVAAGPLEHARQALKSARRALSLGKFQGSERAKQIAWSALSLASRRIARAAAKLDLAAALRRQQDVRASAVASAEALEVSRKRLAAARDRLAAAAEPSVGEGG